MKGLGDRLCKCDGMLIAGRRCEWDLERDGISWRDEHCYLYLSQAWRIIRFEPYNKNTRLVARMRVRMR